MSKSRWTEEKIEDLLKQMPTVIDSRHPRELYKRIEPRLGKKKKTGWLVPGLASLAAVVLVLILIPNYTGFQEVTQQSKSQKGDSQTDMVENDSASFKFSEKREQDTTLFNESVEMEKTAVYQEDLEGKDLVIYGIPDRNAQNIIQVGVLINKNESKTWLQQFIDTMPLLTEEAWGLSEYYPLNGTFALNSNQKSINLNVPASHQYGMGSASEIMFQKALITSFLSRKDIERITFSTDDNPGIFLGNGMITELDLNPYRASPHAYFLMNIKGKNSPLLVPNEETVGSLKDAFAMMKNEVPTRGLHASIPQHFKIAELAAENDTVVITLKKDAALSNSPDMKYTIEAILLTVKDFGYTKIVLRNVNVANIGPFRMDAPIEVPIAANKMVIQ